MTTQTTPEPQAMVRIDVMELATRHGCRFDEPDSPPSFQFSLSELMDFSADLAAASQGVTAAPPYLIESAPPQQPGSTLECTRSHPHENMNPMCELRTKIARLENAAAALPSPGRGMVPMTTAEIDLAVRNAQIAFALDKFKTFEEALVRKAEAHHGIKEGS